MKSITVISGGYGGMGKAVAKDFGEETALVLAGRSEEKLVAVKKEMMDLGYEVYTYKCDVIDRENVMALAKYAASLGEVKNVIHTAGVSPASYTTEPIYKTNAIGTVNMVDAFYDVISEGGTMINFASVAAYQAQVEDAWLKVYQDYEKPEFFDELMELVKDLDFDEFLQAGNAYAISKRFVIYYTQMNVTRFYEKGARILSISPGPYMTPMHQALLDNQPDMAEDQLNLIPAGRWGHPYEIGALAKFLCSKGAGYIGGVDILTDGAQIAGLFTPQI